MDKKIIQFPKGSNPPKNEPTTTPQVQFNNVFTEKWFNEFLTEQRKEHGFTPR